MAGGKIKTGQTVSFLGGILRKSEKKYFANQNNSYSLNNAPIHYYNVVINALITDGNGETSTQLNNYFKNILPPLLVL